MSEMVFASRAGDFTTARRGSIAADADFIIAKRLAGFPLSAIALMTRRNVSDVATMCHAVDAATAIEAEDKLTVAPAPVETPKRRARSCSRPHMRERSMPDLARLYVEEACRLRSIEVSAVIGDGPGRHVTTLRQEIYWRLQKAGYNNCEIGQFIGNRDPSTVRYGISAHKARLGLS